MYPTANGCDTSFLTLDSDDIAGIRSLYPSAPTTAPSTPSNPSPSSSSTDVSTTLTLSWSAANAQSYDVYVNGSLQASGITKASYSMSGLPYSTNYSWYVVAKNSVGTAIGPMWSFTTQASSTTTTTTKKGKGRR
jgi:mevalonate pyrophosphate decarboxylase